MSSGDPPRVLLALSAAVFVTTIAAAQTQFDRLPLEHPAIRYATEAHDNPVTWLIDRLDHGETTLVFRNDGFGYLPSLLDELDINIDSQLLVSSSPGGQTALTSDRAIYFNDDTAVRFVRGGTIELATFDSDRGSVFYTLPARRVETPRPARAIACLRCHVRPLTTGIPGPFVESNRWRDRVSDETPTQSNHLVPESDRVAHLTLEHQTQMVNLLTRLEWESKIARHGGLIGYALAEHMRNRVDDVVAHMLFVDEAPFTAPIMGASTFAETFPQRGPHDRNGRSLRDFDLETRLFRYPLSYMVYSRTFDTIEPVVREYLLRRLFDVLIGDDASDAFSAIPVSDRQAILAILRDTKPNLPAYWRTR